MIPALLPALERHGRLRPTSEERELLLSVSAATIDRMLVDVKIAAAGGRRRRVGFYSAIRREVPRQYEGSRFQRRLTHGTEKPAQCLHQLVFGERRQDIVTLMNDRRDKSCIQSRSCRGGDLAPCLHGRGSERPVRLC